MLENNQYLLSAYFFFATMVRALIIAIRVTRILVDNWLSARMTNGSTWPRTEGFLGCGTFSDNP